MKQKKIISAKRSRYHNYKRVPFVGSGSIVNVCSPDWGAACHLTAALANVVKIGKCLDFRCERNYSALIVIDNTAYNTPEIVAEFLQLARAKGTMKHDYRNGNVEFLSLDPKEQNYYSLTHNEILSRCPDVVVFLLSPERYDTLKMLKNTQDTAFIYVCRFDAKEEKECYSSMRAAECPCYLLSYQDGHSHKKGELLWDYKLYHLQPTNEAARACGVDMYFHLGLKSKTPWRMGKGELSARCYVWSFANKYNRPYSASDRNRLRAAEQLGIVSIDRESKTFSYIDNKINNNILKRITNK